MSSVQARQRPGLVTALAVINFILGGMGLLGSFCGGLGLLFIFWLAKNMPAPPGGGPNPLQELADVFQSIPGYVPIMITAMALGLIMQIVLIATGFGLLKMRNWARHLCFVYAIYTLIGVVGMQVYQYVYVQPAMEKWQADFQQRMQKAQAKAQGGAGGAPAPAPAPANPFGGMTNAMTGIAASLFSIAHAIGLLVILNLPDVRRAFTQPPGAGDFDDRADDRWGREPPDHYDEGRGGYRPGEPRDYLDDRGPRDEGIKPGGE